MSNAVIAGEKYSLPEIYEYIGGQSTPDSSFLIQLGYSWTNDMMGEPQRAEGAGIVFCVKGEAKVNINMREVHLTPNSVMLYGRESIVEFQEMSEDFTSNILFFTQGFMSDTLLDLQSVMPIIKYVTDNSSELIVVSDDETEIIEKYFELLYMSVSFKKVAIIRDLMVAFARVLSEIYNRRLDDTVPRVKTRQEEYLENFLREVAEHHKQERSVKYYADKLHITPKYLSTVIKEVSGESATSLINKFVIQEAKVLLRFSGMSIQEITYELNFSTQSFFGKYFKRHTGMSPSEYRASE